MSPGNTKRWKDTFQQMVENSLRHSITLVEGHPNAPQAFRPHMDSMSSQIGWGMRFAPELSARLMVAAYPWPARWGLADAWRRHLEQARGALDRSHPLQRQSQACLADIFQFSGQPEKVLQIGEALFSDPSTPPEEFALLVARAGGAWLSALASQGKPVEVEQAAGRLWERLESAGAQSHSSRRAEAQAVVLLHRSILARRKGDLPLALELVSRAIEGLEQQVDIDRGFMSEIIQSRAIYHWVGANYAAALADLEYARKMSASANDDIGLCSAHGNRGLVYWSMSEYDQAEREFLEAIRLSEKNKLTYLLMKQVGNLGMVYFNRGDLQNALRYIDRGRELAEISGDDDEKALAEGNKAAVQIYTDRPQLALPGLLATRQKYLDTERFETLLGVLADLSVCHYRIGELAKSADFARQALDLAREKNNPSLILVALRARALSAPAAEAVDILKHALQLAERLDRKLDAAGCKLCLARLSAEPASRDRLWGEAADILAGIGAVGWIENRSVGDAVILPLTI